MWDKRAQLVRVVDGDTLIVLLDQGFRDVKEIDARLFGVYSPERGEPGGSETRQFIEQWCEREKASSAAKWPLVVTTVRMVYADKEQKTFDRYLCTITSIDGSRNLNLAVQQFVTENGYGPGDT